MHLSFGHCSVASLFALSLFTRTPSTQTTWYIAAGAPAPGLDTEASPYASLQYAIDRPTTVEGDTLLVAPGTYTEQITLNGRCRRALPPPAYLVVHRHGRPVPAPRSGRHAR